MPFNPGEEGGGGWKWSRHGQMGVNFNKCHAVGTCK